MAVLDATDIQNLGSLNFVTSVLSAAATHISLCAVIPPSSMANNLLSTSCLIWIQLMAELSLLDSSCESVLSN